jgi:hypothetical protein
LSHDFAENSVVAGVHFINFLPSIVVGDVQILCHGDNESTNETILKMKIKIREFL